MGLVPYQSELESFQSKLSTFYSEANNSLNTSSSIRVDQVDIENQIKNEYSSYTNIVYSTAFTQSDGTTYTDVPSAFKEMYYGPVTDSSKILGNIYSGLRSLFGEVNAALDPMISAWGEI